MIRTVKGNMLQAPAEALVNTVNTVGVMGKGIALQFKESFPDNFAFYARAVKAGDVQPGRMLVFESNLTDGRKIIVNFPTKTDWRRPSEYRYIESGLDDLARVIREYGLRSIAIPPLGCGNGGLDWQIVRSLIEKAMSAFPELDVLLYEPDDRILKRLSTEQTSKKVKLTPVKAMLLYALSRYEQSGEDVCLFAANKLAYFLQVFGAQLNLRFVRHLYGPYSNQIDHLMYDLDGYYIRGNAQRRARAFDPLQVNDEALPEIRRYIEEHVDERQRSMLNRLLLFIRGFESPLALEALASTHTVLHDNPEASPEDVFREIQGWNDRKKNLFTPFHINTAFDHLMKYRQELLPI